MSAEQQAQEEEFEKLVKSAKEIGVLQGLIGTVERSVGNNQMDLPTAIVVMRGLHDQQMKMHEVQTKLQTELEASAAQSIGGIYMSALGEFQLPPININSQKQPSIRGGTVKAKTPSGETISVKKPKAEILELKKGHYVPIKDVQIPTEYEDGTKIMSILGPILRGQSEKKLNYVTEADVQMLCVSLIKDALNCLGLPMDKVSPHAEVSIYTMQPGIHLVVLRREGRIIFVVEVKCPEINSGEVFESEKVAGQIGSYLMALRSLGDATPMGAIMTYNKIALVTIGDYSNNESFNDAVNKTREHLRTKQKSTMVPLTPPTNKDCLNRNVTPVRLVSCFSDNTASRSQVENKLYELKDEDKDEVRDLKAHMSKVHENGEVFPFLLQALQIAYKKGEGVYDSIVTGVKDKGDLGKRLTFKVSETSCGWVETRKGCTASMDHNKFADMEKNKFFYILGKLGEGRNAAVYLAVSSKTGSVCAMKCYNLELSGTPEKDEDDRKSVEVTSKAEETRWETLYSEERNFKACARRLNGSPCLLMPYGRPIVGHGNQMDSSTDRIRWEKLSEIKSELVRFAEKGFVYDQSDLRWAHVLVDGNDEEEKIFFCDLESLENVEEMNEHDAEVRAWEQVKVLVRAMIQKHDGPKCLAWVQKNLQKAEDILKVDLQGLVGDPEKKLGSLFPVETTYEQLSPEAIVCLHAIWFFKEKEEEGIGKAESPNSDSAAPSLRTSGTEMQSENEESDSGMCAKEGRSSDESEKQPAAKRPKL